MKKVMLVGVFLLLVGGCGGNGGDDDLKQKNEQLAARVKTLEDRLFEMEKKAIQHEQAMQTIRQRQREMEDYFNRLQVSQSRR